MDVQVPDSVPVDLRTKLIVCFIHLHVYAPTEVKQDSKTYRAQIINEVFIKRSFHFRIFLLIGLGFNTDGAESRRDRRLVPGCR